MKLEAVAPASDIKKSSSGLLDVNKSAHHAKRRLAGLEKAEEKGSAPKLAKAKAPESKKKEEVVVEAPKRFSVSDFVKQNF